MFIVHSSLALSDLGRCKQLLQDPLGQVDSQIRCSTKKWNIIYARDSKITKIGTSQQYDGTQRTSGRHVESHSLPHRFLEARVSSAASCGGQACHKSQRRLWVLFPTKFQNTVAGNEQTWQFHWGCGFLSISDSTEFLFFLFVQAAHRAAKRGDIL